MVKPGGSRAYYFVGKGRAIRVMEELLKSFSPVEIILCVWLVVKGLTEVIQKFDWGKSRLKQVFDSDYRA